MAASEMSAEVAPAAEVMTAKTAMSEVVTAAVTAHVEAVMASMMTAVVATVPCFGCQRHCQCSYQRRHENETPYHKWLLYCFIA
jgi:hypothetical protein